MRAARRLFPLGVIGLVMLCTVLVGPPVARQITYAVESGRRQASITALAELGRHDRMSALFRDVAKAVKPAVVVVHVKQKVDYAPVPFPEMDDFFRRFFGDDVPGPFRFRWRTPQRQPEREFFYRRGLGSGVVVDAERGYVLTNWHVVHDADEVEIALHDGRKLDADWVRTDRQTDLAVLKIKPDRLHEARLGDSDHAEVGDWVLAIGAPEGLPQTVTAGIISAKGRTTGRGGYESLIQTDAAINHGNSGGPLVNMRGEVIGINTAIVSRTGVNEGIGLSIPSNMAKGIMRQLIDSGEVVRGYLGVTIQNVDDRLARSFNLPHRKGALVTMVAEGSPAEKAGVKTGDFIVELDGHAVEGVNELRNRVAAIEPGTQVKMGVYRDGRKQILHVRIGKQPADMAGAFGQGEDGGRRDDAVGRFGLEVATMNDDYARKFGYSRKPQGVVILSVDERSSAAEQGLRPGDVITNVQGKEISSVDDLARSLSSKTSSPGVRMRVRSPNGGIRFVFVTPSKG